MTNIYESKPDVHKANVRYIIIGLPHLTENVYVNMHPLVKRAHSYISVCTDSIKILDSKHLESSLSGLAFSITTILSVIVWFCVVGPCFSSASRD